MAVKIDAETCIGCGACIDTCPVNALRMENDKAVVDPETCIDCGNCISACPSFTGSIKPINRYL